MGRKLLAWLVHLYTAIGLVLAAAMAVLIIQGGPRAFREVILLMLLATVVDSTDGFLARAARVKEVLPSFDGRRLDDLIDFLTYAFLPLLLLYRAGVPAGHTWILVLPLLASAYGFCQAEVKTDDGYFLGFPSYWNVVAVYLIVLHPVPVWLTISILLMATVLTFVPTRYIYPSQPGTLNRFTSAFAVVWAGLVLYTLYRWRPGPVLGVASPRPERLPALISLAFPVYYMVASFVVTAWRRRP
jgi:phosphatidylcholine synthase